MGYQVGSACFDNLADAASALVGIQNGQFLPGSSSVVKVTSFSSDPIDSSVSITASIASLDGSYSYSTTQVYTVPACSVLTFDDGVSIGWQLLAAFSAVYAVLFLRRAIF